MSRRHALAALAGAATAGLGIGGWEAVAHAGTGKPAVPAFSLPKVAPGKVAWRFNANANVASIVQSGNVVYASTNGNAIFAVNATTGKLIWKRTTTSEINQALAVVGKNVVVSGGNGPFGMAGRTGKQTWSIKQEDGSFLVTAGRVVYAGFAAKSNTTGGVTALDPATGTILWTYAFGPVSDIGGQMVVEKGTLYVATGDTEKGEIWAFSTASGGVRRRVAGFPQFGAGTLAVINGVVYAGVDNNKGTVVAVNMASGKTLWEKAVGAASFPPYMSTTNGILFAGTVEGGMAEAQTGKLYALNAKTGDVMWSIPIDGGVNSGPIAAPGVVYTAGGNQVSGNGKPVHGILEAWQPTTGKKLWSYTSKVFMGNMTVVPGSRVYVSGGGYLYSLGA